jgi:hypothetical protein
LIDELVAPMSDRWVEWLSDRKNKEAFTTRPLNCSGTDTVSRLASAVSKCWKKPSCRIAPLADFAYLFPRPEPLWFQKAGMRQAEYKAEMAAANALCNVYSKKGEKAPRYVEEQCRELRQAVCEKYGHLLDACPDTLKAAAAIWHYAHNPQSLGAGFAFLTCLPEILGQLETLQLDQFNVFHIKAVVPHPVLAAVVWNGEYKKLVTRCGVEVGDVPAFTPLTEMVVKLEEKAKTLVAVVVGEESLDF